MADNTVLVNMKVVSDISDVVSNVGAIQKSFSKLKLPEKLGEGLNKNITEFYKEYDKYQKKVAEGLKTQGDYNQVEKSLNRMKSLYETIGKEASKVTKLDLDSLLDLGSGDFKKVADEIAEVVRQINQVKIDPSAITGQMKALRGALKGEKFSKEGGLLDQLIGNVRSGNLLEAKKVFKELQAEAQKIMPKKDANGDFIAKMVGKLNPTNAKAVTGALKEMGAVFDATDDKINPLNKRLEELQKELQDTKNDATGKILGDTNDFNEYGKGVESVTESLKKMHQEEFNFNRQAQDIDRQIQSYFGLSQMIRKVGDIARDAFATVKDLDKAMTETAVVTNFDVGDMWDMLPTYTAQANQLGSTIKDVYEAATLYYQQGLNTNQAMGLANETLKMARIAGLDATEATNMMTAALRGFNMEVNQMSAQKINDIYSELAAITASDTKEIGSAMERTASIANAANMEFATTSAFLAQMIETTREAPENLGTAMKTIVARFQEMKQDPTKLVDSEGVAMDVNKVDKALKTIGVSLTNTKGEFRDLDDVFLDISAKWDSLSQGQQRYIATIAAGSRQQSRFIAMMSNYERTMELVDAANNSAGASQRQFEKTLDSMEAKLNKLKNAWDQFTMGLMNNQIIKFGVDRLTDAFTIVNKLIDVLSKLGKPFGLEGLNKSLLTLATTIGMLQLGKRGSRGLVQGAFGWWKEGKSFTKSFSEGWAGPEGTKVIAKQSKYGDAIKANILAAKIPQAIQGEFQKGKILATAAFNTGTQLIALNNIINTAAWDSEAKALGMRILQEIEAEIEKGEISPNALLPTFNYRFAQEYGNTENWIGKNQLTDEAGKVEQLGNEFTGLGSKITKAGTSLQAFGAAMQGTPFEPFGNALMHIGNLLISCGDTAVAVSKKLKKAFEAAKAAEGGLGAKTGTFFTTLFQHPKIMLAIALLSALAFVIYKVATANKKALESASDAAAAASEAYDSAKQETSELADAISKIQETDSAFDGLVAGTAEFNEQLVTANEQIMALIDKYPMLNDSRYLSTDKNGRMRINQAGLDAVQEYQKQIQANASAMNLIQTADLNAVENQQKADELRKAKGDMTTEELEKNRKQADLLEQRIKAETDLARQNAIRVSLADKELHSAETMAKIMADQYETKRESAKLDVEAMSKHERRQAYADYHGYTYDKSTKKIKDVEGNEVDYDDEAIKDEVIEQQVILEFREDAESLERTLSSVNSKFASGLEEQTAGSAHVISDILSSNIETDEEMLRKVLSEPNQLQGLVDSLSEAEMAAILGISASSITDETIDQYKTDIVNKLTGNAEKIAEAQAESYTDLATMIAKAQDNILDKNGNIVGQKGQTTKQIEQAISQQINNLKPEYAHLMSSIGTQLQEFAGEDTMSAFVNTTYDIYAAQGEHAEQTINELNQLIDNTNFDSAISRLSFYNKAVQSEDKSIQNLGKTMRATTGEANLLGQAFDEFLGSSDWTELSEKTDEFKNALGEYDAAGIQKAAEQSRTLNELLKTGAVSAGGVAAALQGIEDGTIANVNSTVLTLLSSFNRLADAASEAHKIIEGFDPGIDTGEGEDFVKENAEKFKEYYKNGEFGNEQLQNYIKLAAGTDKWNEALRDNHGNLQEAAKDLKHYVTAFDEGFVPVYDKLTQGFDLKGNKISDKVKQEFEGLEFLWDENNELQINLADFGTEDLQNYLQKALGISEDYAKLMLQNLANYDTTLSSELRANDIKKSLSNKDFQESHQDNRGKFVLSDSDIRAVGASLELKEDINTKEGLEEATKAIEKLAGVELEVFKTQNEDGSQREDYGQLLTDYAKTFYGQNVKDLFGVQELQQGGKFDVGKLINDSIAKGMDSNQASQAAYEAIQTASAEGITDLLYNGQLLDLSEITSYEDFLAATQKLTDSAQWYEVGQSIAEGIISYIEGKDSNSNNGKPGKSSGDNEQPDNTDNSNKSKSRKGTTIPGVGYVEVGESAPKEKDSRNLLQKLDDWFVKGQQNQIKNMNGANSQGEENARTQQDFWKNLLSNNIVRQEQLARQEQNQTTTGKTAEQLQADNKAFWSNLINNSDRAAEARDQKLTAGIQQSQQQNKETTTNTDATANGIDSIVDNVTSVSKTLTTGATQLSTAATALNGAADKLSNVNSGNGTKPSSVAPTINTGAGVISGIAKGIIQNTQSSFTVDTGDSEGKLQAVKQSGDEAFQATNKTSKFTITTPGAKKLTDAAKDAKAISKSAGTKTIGVKTGKADTSSVKTAQNTINNTQAKIKVGATVDSAIAAARRAQRTINGLKATINISPNFTGSWRKTLDVYENKHAAKGLNNHGIVAPPSFGSAARGRYGQVGPKGKGGLTLTGEEGYEIAWLPSENRSLILGANGPQMLNLPGNAVVWTHEQSKKMVKQKAIPAGSHANTSIQRPGSSSASTITKNKQDKKSSQSASKAIKTIETVSAKAGKVFVWWENMARSVEKAQRDAEKNQKTLERLLKNFGTTLSEYDEASKPYKEALEKQIDLANQRIEKANDELHITDYGADSKKSNDYLAAIGARQEISYEITKTKKKKGKKKTTTETKKETLNLAKYIKLIDGVYQLNQEEISKVAKSNKSRAEAIKAAAEKQLNDLYSKLKSAEDDRIKAEEALQQFYNDAYAAFYRWDKSITQIYLLGQQLEKLGNLNSIYEAAVEVQTSKLEAGFGQAIEVLPQITSALEKNRDILIEQVQTNDAKMQAAWQEYNDALSLRAVTEKYLANQNSTDAAYDYDVMKNTLSFLQSAGLDKGKFNLDTAAKALEELYANQWKGDDYDKIKEGLDKIAEKQGDYYTALADTYQSITEVYNKIEEYQSYMSDFESTLIKGLEEQTKAEVDKLSKLNDSLSKAMQNLLDEVKRRLDERRKREDNAKTEQDISQKEQRLAALRADTASGHATEIAQLEKEIAEARQNYGRTLEDQLLDRLSQQQDEAQKQRERQIALLETQAEIAVATGTNVQQINEWLRDPQTYAEEIKNAFLANNNFEELGELERKQLLEEFESKFGTYLGYAEVLPSLEQLASQDWPESISTDVPNSLSNIEDQLDGIIGLLSDINQLTAGLNSDAMTLDEFKAQGADVATAKALSTDQGQNYTVKDYLDAGYTPTAVREGGFTAKNFHDDDIELSVAQSAGFTNPQLVEGGYEIPSVPAPQTTTTTTTTPAKTNLWKTIQDTLKKLNIDAMGGTLSPLGNAALTEAKKHKGAKVSIGGQDARVGASGEIYWDRKGTVRKWNPGTGKVTPFKYNKATYIKEANPKNSPYVYEEFAESLHTRKVKGYKTGGLATQTGPAWLDGTPAKPELVLNAQDTKNFIALKDILAHAMGSTNNINNSYGGNATYEININVDHINNDYDVDKITKRVKENIIKDSSYRNVTQVRKFR